MLIYQDDTSLKVNKVTAGTVGDLAFCQRELDLLGDINIRIVGRCGMTAA